MFGPWKGSLPNVGAKLLRRFLDRSTALPILFDKKGCFIAV